MFYRMQDKVRGHEAQTLELLRVLELVVGRASDGVRQSSTLPDDTAVLSAVVDIPAPLWQVCFKGAHFPHFRHSLTLSEASLLCGEYLWAFVPSCICWLPFRAFGIPNASVAGAEAARMAGAYSHRSLDSLYNFSKNCYDWKGLDPGWKYPLHRNRAVV